MKTLLVMRHAKSSWSDGSLSDFERPLNERGLRDAPRMGQLLVEEGLHVDAIVSSSAVRARTTAELISGEFPDVPAIVPHEHLYHAPATTWETEIRRLPDDADCVLIIGHNPGLQMLVAVLSGEHHSLPTATIACFRFPIDRWSDATPGRAEFVAIWRPKEIE